MILSRLLTTGRGASEIMMSTAIFYDQEPILLEDTLPQPGDILPFFRLVNTALEDVTLDAFRGQNKIMHIFPSIDTPTSAQGVRRFESMAHTLTNTAIIHISADLPFALARFCAEQKLPYALTLSSLRGRDMLGRFKVEVQRFKTISWSSGE